MTIPAPSGRADRRGPSLRHAVAIVAPALALLAVLACGPGDEQAADAGGDVVVTVWRHHIEQEIEALEVLIERFEAAHPGVHVALKTFPLGVYKTKVVATLSAGRGPDIVNIHNSWVYDYVDSGLIEPVPDGVFADGELDDAFFPLMRSFTHHGRTYAVPIGGANLGLFYNRAMLAEAGVDPPRTWEEFRRAADTLARRDRHGRLTRAGASVGDGDGQGWNYFVDGVLPQAGVAPLAADGRAVAWNTPAGADALAWFTGFMHGDDAPNSVLFPRPNEAFRLGLSAMIIDGNWRIGALAKEAPELDYGTATVPVGAGGPATYGTAWGHAVTDRTAGATRDAAWALVAFLAEYDSMTTWSEHTGELPMRRRVLADATFRAHIDERTGGRLAPFLAQMEYADASLKKDEALYKGAIVEAIDRVLLRDVDPAVALADAADEIDAMLGVQ